jgi:hypothetical protein
MIFAHGTGPGHDLPVPLFHAITGGALAVFVSFLAMAVLWPESRLRGAAAGRPLSVLTRFADSAATRWTLRLLALALTVAVIVRGAMLPDNAHVNPLPSVVYGVLWVGLVFASLAFGPVWRLLNPLRTAHTGVSRMLGRNPRDGMWALPRWIGYWPAAIGLTAFVWMELVSFDPDSVPALARFFTVYAVVHLAGAVAFGSRWFDRGDAFEVLSDLIGRLALLGRRSDGALALRSPLNGLDTLRPAPGLVVTICVMLASTAYDSVTALWNYGTVRTGTIGLLIAVAVVIVLYSAAAKAAGLIGERRGTVAAFAHSLIPIAAGYLVAHYLAFLLGEAQRATVLMLGSDAQINEQLLPAGLLAVIQVGAIITGHVLGVIAAHDRAVRLFEPRVAVAGQVPLMVLMVVATTTGLTLLASG